MRNINSIIFLLLFSLLYIGCSKDEEEEILDSYIEYSIDGKTYKDKATATLYYDSSDKEYILEIKSNDIEIWDIVPKDVNELSFIGEYNLGDSDISFDEVPDLMYDTYFRSDTPLFYGTKYTTDNNSLVITDFIIYDSLKNDPIYIPKSGTVSGNFVAKVYFMDVFDNEPEEFILNIEGTINNVKWNISW